jgi:16S rRNA processing protein RimM
VPQQPQHPSEKRKADVNAGRIAGVFGLQGELKLDASRVGDDAMRAGLAVTLRLTDGTTRTATIAGVRRQKDRPLIRIAGVEDADAGQALVGAQMTIARDDAPLGEREYFDEDLVGCRLLDEAGVERGVVVDVLHYPNQDLLVIGPARAMLPLVAAFIAGVDVASKAIHVTVPEGLLDPSAADEA